MRGVKLRDLTEIECDMVVVAAGIRPNTDVATTSGFTVERAIVVDDQMRTVEDATSTPWASASSTAARCTAWSLRCGSRPWCSPTMITGADPHAQYLGSRTATKLKVAGVEVASMGVSEPERETDEHIVFSEPSRGVYKSVVVRDGKVIGATLLGDSKKVALPAAGLRPGAAAAGGAGGAAVRPGRSGGGGRASRRWPTTPRSATATASARRRSWTPSRPAARRVTGVMDTTRAGKGCGSCKGLVAQLVEWAADGAVEEDPSVHYYVPGIPMDKPKLMAEIRDRGLRSVAEVFAALAPEGAEDAKSKMGLASLLKMMWGSEAPDDREARFINDRVHANIQKDGTFSVVPQMRGGVTTPEQLRRIADVAEKYNVPMVKLTGGQRIDLLGIKKEDLPKVWADLDMPSGYAYGKSFRTVKTCVGQEFCRFGTGDSTKLGIEMETRLQGMESPAKMKLAVSGCPRNCAESLVKDVGIVAIEGGRWEIYIGGAAGAHIRKGDLLCTVDDAETAKLITGRFLQYYRENAKWLERTYAFVPRVGLEHVRAVVVDDSEGIAERLDAEVQKHADTYRDPWLDGKRTGHARPVPHLAAAGGAAPRAQGPGRDAARRPLVSTDTRRLRPAPGTSSGPVGQVPPGEGRAFVVAGEQVAVFRLRDGSLRAVSAVCPHKGGPHRRRPDRRPEWSCVRCT